MTKMQDPISSRSTLWILALQLLAIPAYVFAASALSQWQFIVPAALKKQTPLNSHQLVFICLVFLVWHLIAYLISRKACGPHPFASIRRGLIELVFSLIATSFSSSTLFLLTDLPFSANYYAWIYVLETGCYLLVTLTARSAFRAKDGSSFVQELGGALRLIINPLLWIAFVLILTPGILALLYKANPDFANQVNLTRATLSSGGNTALNLESAITGLDQPIFAKFHDTDANKLYWLSRPGRLSLATINPWKNEVLVDLTEDVNSIDGEMGAFSFALHPDFGQSQSEHKGHVYIWYSHWNTGAQRNRLARFDISLNTLEERQASKQILLDYPRKNSKMHNGGTLLFGVDGFLYLSIGDAVDINLAQTLDKQLASGIIRIDVNQTGGDVSAPIERRGEDAIAQNYFIPKDNPWFAHPTALQEFWAIGFRNPFRMSFDEKTGDLWLGDVGWDGFEELNRVQRGDNGQWPYMEGVEPTSLEKPPVIAGREIKPIYHYAQTALKRAVIGGLMYYGNKFPELKGKYVFADNNAGLIMLFDPAAPEEEAKVITRAGQFAQYGITSLLTDRSGEIYITVLGSKDEPNGQLLRLIHQGANSAAQNLKPSQEKDIDEQYEIFCSRCHGSDGKGNPEVGEQLVERPDFTSAEWQANVSDEHIHKVIALGGVSEGLSEQMPAWGSVFSEAEIDRFVKKIRAFR